MSQVIETLWPIQLHQQVQETWVWYRDAVGVIELIHLCEEKTKLEEPSEIVKLVFIKSVLQKHCPNEGVACCSELLNLLQRLSVLRDAVACEQCTKSARLPLHEAAQLHQQRCMTSAGTDGTAGIQASCIQASGKAKEATHASVHAHMLLSRNQSTCTSCPSPPPSVEPWEELLGVSKVERKELLQRSSGCSSRLWIPVRRRSARNDRHQSRRIRLTVTYSAKEFTQSFGVVGHQTCGLPIARQAHPHAQLGCSSFPSCVQSF